MKRNNILKEAGVLLIVSLLLLSSLSIAAATVMDTSTKNIQTISNEGLLDGDGHEIITDVSFENDTFPSGWTQDIKNTAATWKIEDEEYLWHSKPYYAVCYNHENESNEWLKTPSLNFSTYKEIKLSFYWMMGWWIAAYADYCDLNVSISTDGGSHWKVIWSEDKYKHPLKQFDDYVWYDTNVGGKHIDLSDYAGENDVMIGFQYNGSDGCQIYLDDITIYGDDPDNPNPLKCDAHGPYKGKAAETIYFYGEGIGGQKPYIWRWDFGDGSFFDYRKNPTHKYYELGVFNISLRVLELGGMSFDINYTNVRVGIPDPGPPILKIVNISGGFGIRATIKNDGLANITEVKWEIHARGGPLNIFDKKKNGSFAALAPGDSKDIRLRYFLGFGRTHIKILAVAVDAEAIPRERDAFKIGPFVLGVH